MFAVAGVTGNTGRAAADALLRKGERVRVIVRDAAKGDAWRTRGAEFAVASLDNVAALTAALNGTRGAYLLLPPVYAEQDVLEAQRRVAAAIAEAVKQSDVGHVVFLSSIAAQHASGVGWKFRSIRSCRRSPVSEYPGRERSCSARCTRPPPPGVSHTKIPRRRTCAGRGARPTCSRRCLREPPRSPLGIPQRGQKRQLEHVAIATRL